MQSMKPFYEDDLVSLYHGDLFDVLPTIEPGSIHSLITDPPYCSGAPGAGVKADPITKYCQNGNALGRPSFGGDSKNERGFSFWCLQWLRICRQLVKEGGYGLVFIDWRNLPSMCDALQAADWIHRGVAAWDKGLGSRSPHKGYFRHQCEYIVWGTNGPCRNRDDAGPFVGCHHIPNDLKDKHHITGKPVKLMAELVKVAPVGETILDPFAGSGTTLLAARQAGRKAIGIERERSYCEITARRLQAAAQQAA